MHHRLCVKENVSTICSLSLVEWIDVQQASTVDRKIYTLKIVCVKIFCGVEVLQLGRCAVLSVCREFVSCVRSPAADCQTRSYFDSDVFPNYRTYFDKQIDLYHLPFVSTFWVFRLFLCCVCMYLLDLECAVTPSASFLCALVLLPSVFFGNFVILLSLLPEAKQDGMVESHCYYRSRNQHPQSASRKLKGLFQWTVARYVYLPT